MAVINAVGNALTGLTGTGAFVGDQSPTITTPRIAQIKDTNGNTSLDLPATASAVNYARVLNAATAGVPSISAQGSDTDIDISLVSKGDASVILAAEGVVNPPVYIASGTALQHVTNLLFSNTSATRNVTFPDASGTILLSGGGNSAITQVNVQRVTATGAGTYTPTAGMQYVIVQAQAGGGGGGGAATSGVGEGAGANGGGGGGYTEALFTAADIGASKAYSVGAGGAGGAAGLNAGTTGGNTTFNTTWVVANGGQGGAPGPNITTAGASSASSAGGAAGSVATGTAIKILPGDSGPFGFVIGAIGCSNNGGAAGCGAGGPAGSFNGGAGSPGVSGAGGSGASTGNSAQQAGGAGGDGFITFIEFISA